MRTKLSYSAVKSTSASDTNEVVFYSLFPKQWPPQNPMTSVKLVHLNDVQLAFGTHLLSLCEVRAGMSDALKRVVFTID